MYNKNDFLGELKNTYINWKIDGYKKEMESALTWLEIKKDMDEFKETFSECSAKIKELKSDPDYQHYNSLDSESREKLKHLDLEYNEHFGPDKLITVAAFLYPDINDYIHGNHISFKEGLRDTYLSYDDVDNKYNELYYDPEISLSLTDFVFQKKFDLLLDCQYISSNGHWSHYTPDYFYKKFLELEGSFEKGADSLGVDYKTIFPNLSEKFNKLRVTLEADRKSQQSEFMLQPEKAFELFPEAFSYYEFKHPQELMKEVRQAFVNDMRSENFIRLSEDPIVFNRVSELRFGSHEVDIELNQEPDPEPENKEEPEIKDDVDRGDNGLF